MSTFKEQNTFGMFFFFFFSSFFFFGLFLVLRCCRFLSVAAWLRCVVSEECVCMHYRGADEKDEKKLEFGTSFSWFFDSPRWMCSSVDPPHADHCLAARSRKMFCFFFDFFFFFFFSTFSFVSRWFFRKSNVAT
jgi:hypothetical protein